MKTLLREDDVSRRGPIPLSNELLLPAVHSTLHLATSDPSVLTTPPHGPPRPSAAALGGIFASLPVVRRSSSFAASVFRAVEQLREAGNEDMAMQPHVRLVRVKDSCSLCRV